MENIQNSIVYAVNSDLDDGILYAEFETKDAAIEYAKRNLDKFPFVDELQVSRDANGEVDDVFEYKTIWDHTMADSAEEETEDDYWDDLENMYDDSEKHVIGNTTWFESVDTNELVETLEENEDTVECKECFDLFPKADCIKVDFGYICPTCAECGTVSEDDIFKIDFPELKKFSGGNDMIPEEPIPTEEVPATKVSEEEIENNPISTPEEAVPFLVKDEEEAIVGYEQAAEVIKDSDLENKEEILDTIDHIKEEEEEHLEELTDLVDTRESADDDEIIDVDNDPVSGDDGTSFDEHVNQENPAIESDQELYGIDNAVEKCKTNPVITHSKDELPLDSCDHEKLTEATNDELNQIFKICKKIGIKTGGDLNRFIKDEVAEGQNLLDVLKAYSDNLGDDFSFKEKLNKN